MAFVSGALILALVFVNGWTDAPNAIATAVSTRALTVKSAVRLCAICNLLGILGGVLLAPRVLDTILGLGDGLGAAETQACICAAMSAAVLWSVAAWMFGIPTSESHGMLAGAIGASAAVIGGRAFAAPGTKATIFGLFFALLFSFACGVLCCRLFARFWRENDAKTATRVRVLSRMGAAASALLHGAQDGQKFLGMFLLCGLVTNPLTALPVTALLLTLGTALGGIRILRRMEGLVPLAGTDGLAAECASVCTVFVASATGVPVSTTHAKTAGILGSGAARRPKEISVRSTAEMVAAWIATFPVCGMLGFLLAQLFLRF